jgi:ABC-2 type transport system ATP-binding protein
MAESDRETIIRAIGLSKVFRDFWGRPKARAVNDIDFEIKEGEVVGLLGPNGSGKSTTVKMLLGLLYPTAGQLSVFNMSPRAVDTKKLIGYLPEESYLYKYLSASETLDFFAALFNLSAAERKDRSEQLLEMVGLTHAANRPVGEFSKGMARRIGLAQAMINDPSLLILDEPTSGLDPLGCREVKDLIQVLKQRGKTVVVTSHLLSDVEDVCDRVIILYGGKIRATGSLDDLLTIPDSNRITTPLLNSETTQKLLSILRANLSAEDFKIDHPRKSLEEFFLEVISQAREESIETAGVSSGGHIANYLTEELPKEEVLEKLLEKDPEPETSEIPEEEIRETPDKNTLDAIMAEETTNVPVKTEAPEENVSNEAPDSGSEEKLEKANKKLKDLLSDKN